MSDLTLLLVIFLGISLVLFLIRFTGWWIVLLAGIIIYFILQWALDGAKYENNEQVVENVKNTFENFSWNGWNPTQKASSDVI